MERQESVGIILGLIDGDHRQIVSAGVLGGRGNHRVDAHTIFEIGSITKVFTGALLADAIAQRTAELHERLDQFLDLPHDGIGNRTLLELVTHTSGLPVQPTGVRWLWNLLLNRGNPYLHFTQRDLHRFVAGIRLTDENRGMFRYSNLGAGLLGHALAARAKTEYIALVQARLTEPLGMPSTRYTWSDPAQERFAQPHSSRLRTTSRWTFTGIPGAGGLLSCMDDLLVFAESALDGRPPLHRFMMDGFDCGRGPTRRVGFGWMLKQVPWGDIAWHNGRTGGSSAFLAVDPGTRRALVILNNTAVGVDDLAASVFLGSKDHKWLP